MNRPLGRSAFLAGLCLMASSAALFAAPKSAREPHRSITDTRIEWPAWGDIINTLCLRDHNTRVVVLGTTLLGMAAGVVGTFAYLRRRALMGDALSHATLPGIAAVFMIMGSKQLPWLIAGATISGVLGVLAVVGLRSISRLKEDAAIGIVLSVFFGFGMVLFALVQQMRTGSEAGLQSFIYGKAAAMLTQDAWLIGGAAVLVILLSTLFFKEFRIVCFDEQFAGALGSPVRVIDLLMMALVVLTTVVGLQAVGLILIVALLIIPAAAARFWTDELIVMVLLSALFGAVSGHFGATLSALVPRLPTGAIIVLCAGAVFFVSMLAAPRRGVIAGIARHWSLRRRIERQHVLRALAEVEELRGTGARVSFAELLSLRSWSAHQLRRLIRRAMREGMVTGADEGETYLTETGRIEAKRVLRNHRLWEIYLIKYADIAPSHVDRDADEIEHVLSDAVVRDLERTLQQVEIIPPSPHPLEAPA